jgi:acyl carrier protein
MTTKTTTDQLKEFVSRELLDGQDVGLTESTPLLELGLIDSMSIVLLQRFAQSTLGVDIPLADLTPQNLGSINAIRDLVERIRSTPPTG